jgi:hypothetical protein
MAIVDKVSAMKRFLLTGILGFAIIFLLNACASNETASQEPGFQSSGSVAGEKVGGEGVGATAGPSGAGANVKW